MIQMNEEVTHEANLFRVQVLKGRQNLTAVCCWPHCHSHAGPLCPPSDVRRAFAMEEGSDLLCEAPEGRPSRGPARGQHMVVQDKEKFLPKLSKPAWADQQGGGLLC